MTLSDSKIFNDTKHCVASLFDSVPSVYHPIWNIIDHIGALIYFALL